MPIGTRLKVPVADSQGSSQTVYGAVGHCIKTNAMYKLELKTDTGCLLDFLPDLKKAIKPGTRYPVYLIFDNHTSHKTYDSQWKFHELGFQPVFLPASSS